MNKNVLIISHADGDGHLIAEQVRRNLSLISAFSLNVIVDPARTQGHRIWNNLQSLPEIEEADIVFFTDLMFSPVGFGEQSDALTSFCRARPAKSFFAIDHHPMPYARLSEAPNLRAVYRPEVFECAFGPRSGMMVVAAICEHQEDALRGARKPYHDILALGVRRAAAINSPLCGPPLLALVRAARWDVLEDLATEDRAFHRTVRGRRLANSPQSEAMAEAMKVATVCMSKNINKQERQTEKVRPGSTAMPYDVDLERFDKTDDAPPRFNIAPVQSRDLETLVTLLEIAALSLTTSADATFAIEELIEEAQMFGGGDTLIDEDDIKIVLKKASFLKRVEGGRLRIR